MKKHGAVPYDSCYRHKLNMLWPGGIMLKITGALSLPGVLFRLLQWRVPALAAFALAGAALAVLLTLVAVVLRRDRVLNRLAMREREESGD